MNNKGFQITVCIIALGFLAMPFISLAIFDSVPQEYTPLAPLGNIAPDQKVTAETYLPYIFRLGIGLAGGLAVLSITFAGLQWMLSDVANTKSAAKDRIKNSLFGLLIAISSFLLLRTINPDLLNVDLGGPPPELPRVIYEQPAPKNLYELVYYRISYPINVISHEYELSYTDSSGIKRYVRYSTKVQCDTALSSRLEADKSCTKEGSAVNRTDCPYGIPLTSPCTEQGPITVDYGIQSDCGNQVIFLESKPDEYTIVGIPCAQTVSNSPTRIEYASLPLCEELRNKLDPVTVIRSCTLIADVTTNPDQCNFDTDCTEPNTECDLTTNQCKSIFE